jgi:hypothetical protein
MTEFLMPASEEALELLREMVEELVRLGVSRNEAVARINYQWDGLDLSAEDDLVLHETADYWAWPMYFEGEIPDWSPEADKSSWPVKPPPPAGSKYWTIP